MKAPYSTIRPQISSGTTFGSKLTMAQKDANYKYTLIQTVKMKPQKTITLKQWLVKYIKKGGKPSRKTVLKEFGKYQRIKKRKDSIFVATPIRSATWTQAGTIDLVVYNTN
jgi:hypothetical protein